MPADAARTGRGHTRFLRRGARTRRKPGRAQESRPGRRRATGACCAARASLATRIAPYGERASGAPVRPGPSLDHAGVARRQHARTLPGSGCDSNAGLLRKNRRNARVRRKDDTCATSPPGVLQSAHPPHGRETGATFAFLRFFCNIRSIESHARSKRMGILGLPRERPVCALGNDPPACHRNARSAPAACGRGALRWVRAYRGGRSAGSNRSSARGRAHSPRTRSHARRPRAGWHPHTSQRPQARADPTPPAPPSGREPRRPCRGAQAAR